ncbi:MAG: DUF1173 family protein [Burkholderiaceae bacterium]
MAAWLCWQAHLGTVRKHLLQAAENKIAREDTLRSRLYIPEVFSVEQRDAINAGDHAVVAGDRGNARGTSAQAQHAAARSQECPGD